NDDANYFLNSNKMFDYIDIDPFGSPNQFLDSSIRHLKKKGLLAVTATDTAALCGTYPDACKRKYWANPLRNELMHEVGLRIFIRKIQLVASQYDKALTPILSYAKDHYVRVFFKSEPGKSKVNKILNEHNFFMEKGPMWTGNLNDLEVLEKLEKSKLILSLIDETRVNILGFFDVHVICRELKCSVP